MSNSAYVFYVMFLGSSVRGLVPLLSHLLPSEKITFFGFMEYGYQLHTVMDTHVCNSLVTQCHAACAKGNLYCCTIHARLSKSMTI